jgi:hypothetical protein
VANAPRQHPAPVVTHLTRPLLKPVLIVTGDLHAPDGLEVGFELWRVPFKGWDVPHELRAWGRCVPRRFTVVDGDGLVRASGYTSTPTCLPGEPFVLTVASPLAA